MAKKAANKKKSNTASLKLASPAGKAMYPFLFKPCSLFNKVEHKVTLVLDLKDEGVKKYLTEIKKFHDENSSGRLPYTVDKEAGTATIKFRTLVGEGRSAPKVVDARRSLITEDPSIGNNSVIKVSGTFRPYEGFGGGTTAYLNSVQLLDLVPYAPGADDFEDEEGYVIGDAGEGAAGTDDFADEEDEPQADSAPAAGEDEDEQF